MLDQLFWHHKQHHTKVLTQCQLTALKHTYQLSNCITYSVVVIWMISLKVFKHKTHPQKPLNRTKKFRSCTEKEMVPMERCIISAVVTTLLFPFKLLKFWQRIKPDSQNVPGPLVRLMMPCFPHAFLQKKDSSQKFSQKQLICREICFFFF